MLHKKWLKIAHFKEAAFIGDYAFFIRGLIELHQITLMPAFLDGARFLAGEMLRLFGREGGGHYVALGALLDELG